MDGNQPVAADVALEAEGADLRSQVEEPSPFQDDDEVTETQATKDESPKSSDTGAETAAQEAEGVTAKDDTQQSGNAESSAETAEEEQEPKNSYQRRLKDIDRLIKGWNDWNQEKDSFRREFGTISQQLQALTQQRNGAPRQGYTPQEYLDAAKGLERKAKEAAAVGNVEEADKFLNLASQARDHAQTSWQQQVQQQQQVRQAEFGKVYQASIQKEIENWPELGDPTSDASKYMSSLLEQNPEFSMTANGFAKAAQVLRLQMEAAESSALREELEQTKAKLQELEKRTAIKGSSPQQHTSKNFDDMSVDEQRAYLRRGVTDEDSTRWTNL